MCDGDATGEWRGGRNGLQGDLDSCGAISSVVARMMSVLLAPCAVAFGAALSRPAIEGLLMQSLLARAAFIAASAHAADAPTSSPRTAKSATP